MKKNVRVGYLTSGKQVAIGQIEEVDGGCFTYEYSGKVINGKMHAVRMFIGSK